MKTVCLSGSMPQARAAPRSTIRSTLNQSMCVFRPLIKTAVRAVGLRTPSSHRGFTSILSFPYVQTLSMFPKHTALHHMLRALTLIYQLRVPQLLICQLFVTWPYTK